MDSPDKLVRVDVEMLSTPRLSSASVVTVSALTVDVHEAGHAVCSRNTYRKQRHKTN